MTISQHLSIGTAHNSWPNSDASPPSQLHMLFDRLGVGPDEERAVCRLAVRVRLIALAVEGLPAGTYHCVPALRCLRPIGPAPDPDQLKALSYYLSRPASDPQALVVDEAPAVLAIHLDLAGLRRRHGLRALRPGLVETGHLAQNLLLTSAAYGLGTTPLGGLFDGLAHELLALDDLDEPIQYLLPPGRPAAP